MRMRNDIPPVGTYKVDSSFNTDTPIYMPKQLHYSFGVSAGREDYQKVFNPMNNSPRESDSRNSPGPGLYKYKNNAIGVDARKFSFLTKPKNAQEPANIMIKSNVPGPGKYAPVIEMNKVGKYVLSTTPNSRAAAWSPTKVRFFDNQRQKKFIPGPGTYNPSDVDSTNGSYITSNFRNLGNTKFIKPRVKEQFRSKTPANRVVTPGPGTYLLPSDFGYLEAPKASPRGTITQGSMRPRLVSRL